MINYTVLNSIQKKIIQFPSAELLIVTKLRQYQDIFDLYNLGYRKFGENRVQEAKEKYSHNPSLKDISLHLIGPLQTNKVVEALSIFDCIQSIDRPKLVDAISKQIDCKDKKIKTKNFFIQINIGNEIQKSGIPLEEVGSLYSYSINKGLNIIGFMCIPPANEDPGKFFLKMNEIKQVINPKLLLSMGMSNDYEIALKSNSNLIRIGSLIFE